MLPLGSHSSRDWTCRRVDGTRELIVPRTPYVIAYRFAANQVTLLHIFHGARLWPAEF